MLPFYDDHQQAPDRHGAGQQALHRRERSPALAANIAMMSAISALLSALLAGTAEGRTFAVAAGEGGPCAGGAVPLRHGSRRHEFPLLPSAAKYPA